jgi:DNA-binding transcriptional regulator of glucitol operon
VHRYRFAARPGWLALHVFTVAVVVTMVLLGRWQLSVSNSKHFSLQNFGYAIQWWLFSVCAVVFWARLMRDQSRRDELPEPEKPVDQPVAYRRYVMPTVKDEPADAVHAAYNDYLAALAAQDAEESR